MGAGGAVVFVYVGVGGGAIGEKRSDIGGGHRGPLVLGQAWGDGRGSGMGCGCGEEASSNW